MIPRKSNWTVDCVKQISEKAHARAIERRNEYRRERTWQRSLRRQLRSFFAAGVISVGSQFCGSSAIAELPTGADVVAGAAIINASGSVMDVNAASARTIINWDQFSIGAGNTANFNLPDASSAILNRVTTPDMPSVINGALNSNGHVHLVNPSGIMVGATGVINTNAFVASTFDIANSDFLNGGDLTFSNNRSNAAIVNNGTINTGAGGAHLIANSIANSGVLTSVGGNITMSGGGEVTLSNGVNYVQPTLETLASGISPTAGLIQNTGTIRATGAATSGGEVYLVNPNGNILHDGTIAAQNQPTGVSPGSSSPTIGGHVQLEADDITLTEKSSIDATGTDAGGTVLVGGDWQGSGQMTQATNATMEAGATIDASATESGDGGKIVLWSDITNVDSVTKAFGTLIARAGDLFGNGGEIETSGASIDTSGIAVDAGAANGIGGLWLIDPYDYFIDSTAASNIVSTLNTGTSVTVTTTADNATYGSSGVNTGSGDITLFSEIVTGAMAGDATLTLQAARHVEVSGNIDATQNGNTAKLNVNLIADTDGSGDGINFVYARNIKTNGGNLQLGDGSTATIGGQTVKVGGDVYINHFLSQSIETAGGDITINGETIVANSNGVSFDSDGGNIVFDGLLESGNNYTYVDGPDGQTNSWDWSRTDAKDGTAGGSALGDSYLVNITSRLENAIAGFAAGYRGAWIGAYRDTSTPNNWVWADGPEGGQHFFTEVDAGGGSAESGWFSNFGTGEPNGGPDVGGETRGQFFGEAGQWNDLSPSTSFSGTQSTVYSVLGYVRETNATPTAVSIDAGATGTVTLGGVGGGKALASLDVTGGAGIFVNGGVVRTEGLQTFNSPVILGAHTNFSTIQNDIIFNSTVDSDSSANKWDLTTTITPSSTYYWVDWTNWDEPTKTATGTITVGGDVITVSYHNPQGIFGSQTSGGTDYWTGYLGAAFSGESPYVSSNVANGPTGSDIIQLEHAGLQTLTFSESVENLAFSIVSMNGNGYGFDQDFTIESHSGLNGAGPGYFGSGNFTKAVVGNTFQLNDGGVNSASVGGNSEPHGTIRFGNAFSSLTWNSLSDELWNGFTVGVSGTSDTAGKVHFNGLVGNTAEIGAITVNGRLQTTANVAAASSFDVTGLANLGGSITTSGDQTFGSAITIASDLTLETTDNGNVTAISTIDGAHDLTITTDGTGDVTLSKAAGGTDALTGLTITADQFSADGIAVAASSEIKLTTAGASEVTGVISGSDATLAKEGAGTLTLSGTNTYSGGTTISKGAISIAADANLGAAPGSATASHLKIDGGTLIVTDDMTLSSNRGIEFGSDDATIDVSSGKTFQYGGIVDGVGDLTKTSAGTLRLSGANTFDGATRISGGILEANNQTALGDNDSAVTLDDVAGASLNLLSDLEIGSLTGGGSTGGTVVLGSSVFTTGANNSSTTFDGAISGTGDVKKTGSGVFTLTQNNTYTGATTIEEGELILQNNAPILATSAIDGPGLLTIQSTGDRFTSSFDTSTVPLGSTTALGGVTIGKTTNTSDVTIGGAVNAAGPIRVYGDDLLISADLTSAATSGDGILLSGETIEQDAGVTVSTTGANIEYTASGLRSSSSSNRALELSGASGSRAVIDAGGGDISLNSSFIGSADPGGSDRAIHMQYADIKTSGSGTITIVGDATNNTETNNTWGIEIFESLIQSESGAIDITGTGGKQSNNSRGFVVDGTDLKILSESGAITIRDLQPEGLTGNYTGFYLRSGNDAEVYIGADGATVASSTSDILIQTDVITMEANNGFGTTMNTTGSVVIESIADSFALPIYTRSLTVSGGASSLRFGKTTNTTDVTTGAGFSVAGDVEIYGGDITLSGDITTTTEGSDVLLKAVGDIAVNSSTTVQTNNGDITLWSDSDADSNGHISVGDDVTFNSANGLTNQATGGGAITFGGGADAGSDRRPDGFAFSTTVDGIRLGSSSANTTSIYSGGGDVSLKGQTSTTSASDDYTGIVANGGLDVISGEGTIAFVGNSADGIGLVFAADATSGTKLNLNSAATSGTAISLTGTSTKFNKLGVQFHGGSQKFIEATGGGDIAITGDGVSGYYIFMSRTHVLASTGDIAIDGGSNGLTIDDSSIGQKSGSAVAAASGDVTLTAGNLKLLGGTEIETTGTLTLQPKDDSFTLDFELVDSDFEIGSNLSGLTVGKSGNTSRIEINSAQTVAGDINLYGGDIEINAGLTATGSNQIYIDARGTIVDGASGFINANEVAIDATGATTLDSTSNAIGTFAFDGAALTLLESDGMTVGTVGSLGGVVSNSTVDIATLAGDLTIGGDIETTNATAAAITLNAGKDTAAGTATGGNVIVTNDAEVTVGSGGTATIYSGDISDSTGLTDLVGSGSGRFRYNSDEAASNFTLAIGSGVNAIYREQPTVTVAVDSETVTYGTSPDLTATVGNQNGDSLAQIFNGGGITVGGTTSTSGNYTAGSHTLSVSGTGSEQLGYSVGAITGGTLTVNTKAVTTPLVVDNKVYDGTTAATFSASSNGAVAGDVLSIGGTATFVDKNVGTAKTVNVSGLSLSGTDAANYSLGSTTDTSTADITAAAIVVSGLTAIDKTYDGNTNATVDHSGVTFAGMVSGDNLTATATTGTFDNKNVGTGKAVTLSGTVYGGTDVGNYTFTDQTSTTADVTAKSITVSGITAGDRVYDGTTTATIDHNGVTFNGIVSGDSLTASGTTGVFDNKNAGTDKTVTLAGTTYGGTDVGNYSFTDQATATADITAAPIIVSGLIAIDKTYDGNTNATVDESGVTFNGIISGDNLTATGTTGTFDHKNVGAGKAVTLSGTTYGGTDVGNYTFTDQTSTTADVTAKSITVSGITADDRVYDGTTAATIDHNGVTFNGIVSGDSLTASGTTGVFDNKNAGTDKTVTLAGTTYGGTDVGNYSFTDQATTTADISQREITVAGLAGLDKVYDGTTSATVDHSGVTFAGIVTGDSLTATATTGTFDNKNVGTDKAVTLSGTTYGGTDVGNYTFTDQTSTTADVTAKSITVSGITADDRVYDGTTSATVDFTGITFAGMIASDNLTASGTTATFDNKNVGTGKEVTLSGTTYGGTDVGNYDFTNQASTTADISAKSVTVSGIAAADKVYDGSTLATIDLSGVTFNGMVDGDSLTATGTTGVFIDKNVESGKTVNLSGTTYGGTDLGNYTIADQVTALANISRLSSVTWIGGTSGDWSNPANWAGGAIPDLDNVAAVIIPDGVTPTFDNSVAGPVDIESLSGGNLQMDSGTLSVANDATLDDYTQNGGTFNVGGNFEVSNSFYQSQFGAIDVSGDVDINQTTGDLTVWDLSGNNVNLNSSDGGVHLGDVTAGGNLDVTAGNGDIDQLLGTSIEATGTSTFDATGNITLTNPGNDFVGPVNASGNDVAVSDDHGGLILNDITTVGSFDATSTDGPIVQDANGTMTIGGSATLSATQDGNPADVLLNGIRNDFQSDVNASGQNVVVVDAFGGLLLGNINTTGYLGVASAGGPVTQTADGALTVSGDATFVAENNGEPDDVNLVNASNNFGGVVNILADKFTVEDQGGTVNYGLVRSTASDKVLQQNSSEAARDTNTRYTTENNSGGGIMNVVQRYGMQWFFKVVNWLGGESESALSKLTQQNIQSGNDEIFIRNIASDSSENGPVAPQTTRQDSADAIVR